jgi:hypothetical protein
LCYGVHGVRRAVDHQLGGAGGGIARSRSYLQKMRDLGLTASTRAYRVGVESR